MTNNRFKVLEEQTRILHELALTFPQESPQYIAIQNASFALLFAISEHYESFMHYVTSNKDELSYDQKKYLQELGITED